MKKKSIFAMMIICAMATACSETATEKAPEKAPENEINKVFPAIELGNMDESINPADDFFRYCNNNWLKNNPIPEEYTTFGAFTEIDQRNEKLIQGIIDEVSNDTSASQGSMSQKIRDFYNAGMDTVAINERGYSELLPYFEKVDALNNKADLGALLGDLHSNGFGGFFYAGGSPDPKDAEMVIMHLYQGGLSLPDRDDYLEESSQEMRDKYVEHVSNMFQLVGVEPETATEKAKAILDFETQLAQNSMSRVEIHSRLQMERLFHPFRCSCLRIQQSQRRHARLYRRHERHYRQYRFASHQGLPKMEDHPWKRLYAEQRPRYREFQFL